jgi:hypothetical protein
MAVAVAELLLEPLSPELVLVSSPEEARLARLKLPKPAPSVVPGVVVPSRVWPGVAGFYACLLLGTVGPLSLAVLAR